MVDNVIVKKGVSGKSALYDTSKVNLETVADELALLSVGDWEPLKIKINYKQFQKEIKELGRIVELGMIFKRKLKNWEGFSIWERFSKGN